STCLPIRNSKTHYPKAKAPYLSCSSIHRSYMMRLYCIVEENEDSESFLQFNVELYIGA
ncbi:11632_t:CDS:2, partial [Entrophospora sp. SA101]